jgi:hypothetical protein
LVSTGLAPLFSCRGYVLYAAAEVEDLNAAARQVYFVTFSRTLVVDDARSLEDLSGFTGRSATLANSHGVRAAAVSFIIAP